MDTAYGAAACFEGEERAGHLSRAQPQDADQTASDAVPTATRGLAQDSETLDQTVRAFLTEVKAA